MVEGHPEATRSRVESQRSVSAQPEKMSHMPSEAKADHVPVEHERNK
jgi:hypothetical protein